jgi:serine/threonine protein kinase
MIQSELLLCRLFDTREAIQGAISGPAIILEHLPGTNMWAELEHRRAMAGQWKRGFKPIARAVKQCKELIPGVLDRPRTLCDNRRGQRLGALHRQSTRVPSRQAQVWRSIDAQGQACSLTAPPYRFLLHNDLKLKNLLVDGHQARIVDYGMCL